MTTQATTTAAARTATLADRTKLPERSCDHFDECPQHGTPTRKQYGYRGGQAATVWTYKGCGCAVAQQTDVAGLGSHRAVYFTSYRGADSLARLCVVEMSAKGYC